MVTMATPVGLGSVGDLFQGRLLAGLAWGCLGQESLQIKPKAYANNLASNGDGELRYNIPQIKSLSRVGCPP